MNTNKTKFDDKDIKPGKIAFLIIAGIFIVIAILIFLNEYFLSVKEKIVYEEVLRPESALLIEIRAREDSLLTGYGIIDEKEHVYRIPIDSAMMLILEENR